MILLEYDNKGIIDLLRTRFEAVKADRKCDLLDFRIADFDGVVYFISNSESRNIIRVSINLKFFQELQEFKVNEYLKRIYGQYVSARTEPGYCVTLEYDLTKLPDSYAELAQEAGLLRRHCFAAIFEQMFDYQCKADPGTKPSKRAVIHYRDNETMYVQALSDRVTVIFSTVFKDPDDVVLGRIFLQEAVDSRADFSRAPQVLFSQKTVPAELAGTDAARGDNVAYATFILQPFHTNAENRQRTINTIHTLRNYLHYHIKCCKAHLHMRMRVKCSAWLKVLNRARPELHSAGGGPPPGADSSTGNRF